MALEMTNARQDLAIDPTFRNLRVDRRSRPSYLGAADPFDPSVSRPVTPDREDHVTENATTLTPATSSEACQSDPAQSAKDHAA